MRYLVFVLSLLSFLSPAAVTSGSSTASGVSNKMNPALSVNGLFLGRTSQERYGVEYNNIRLQEAEMHFSSVVDPFWKANVIIAVFPEENGTEYGVGVEEASVESTSLPAGLGLKLGKFFLPFGKHSPLHTHHFPFVDAPVAINTYLGEGLTDCGGMMTAGLPTPWYSDAILYCVDGATETFDPDNADVAFGGRLTNFWDLSDNATFELGGSAITGPASSDFFGYDNRATVFGIDMTYKWICGTQSHGPALTIQGELLIPDLSNAYSNPYGWYALGLYRLHHNWWLGACYGMVDTGTDNGLDISDLLNVNIRESKINITFAPSEFSALRAEVCHLDDRLDDTDGLSFGLQANFTIGSHPAHLY